MRVAILGHGVVGGGVSRILLSEKKAATLAAICTLNPKEDSLYSEYTELFRSFEEVLADSTIDIVVETIGGTGIALDMVQKSLRAKKNVVTANKEMIAKHFSELQNLAKENGVSLLFEASVGGGIPVLSAIEHGLVGDKIQKVEGILNGTTNYILTKMEREGVDFKTVLREAQDLGYAEADPTADVEGFDALYKLVILIALIFQKEIPFEEVSRQGITALKSCDFEYARRFGASIKLAALAEEKEGGVAAEVSPVLFSTKNPLSNVDGVLNAVLLLGKYNTAGNFLSGEGAGRFPTAAAIASNVIDIAQGGHSPSYSLESSSPLSFENRSYYLRFFVKDCSGIVGKIGTLFGKYGISLDAVDQIQGQEGNIHFAITTFSALSQDFQKAMVEIKACDFHLEDPLVLPICN